jgi:hypothetical protein
MSYDAHERREGESALKRVSPYPIPDENDQNPSKWDAEKIAYYGLPPKPEPRVQPKLSVFWNRTYSQQLKFVEFEIESAHFLTVPQVASPAAQVVSGGHFQSSDNWSGAYLDETGERTFRALASAWNVPAISFPPKKTEPEYQCAQWIGLDGQRRYLESTLPQVGTLQCLDTATGKLRESAWTQWWVRNDPTTTPVTISGFPAGAGSLIVAWMTVTSHHHVKCNLLNMSKFPPAVACVKMTAPPIAGRPLMSNGKPPRYSVTGATAEWILERPAVIGSPNKLQGFPVYTPVDFDLCLAAGIVGTTIFEEDLSTARFIRMYERSFGPPRTTYISMPNRDDELGFTATYGDVWRGS